jgi:tRNA A-37 threonylcarbamoyl transferase component Bud32
MSEAGTVLGPQPAVDLPRIEGYEILAKLGEGGMGTVYKARQPQSNRLVALKAMFPRFSNDAMFIARFIREAAAAANLDHPNLVRVLASGESNNTRFIAMEFVEGRTLQQHIKRHGRLDAREAIAVTTYVAQALQHAWAKARLVHRDIKPENIFLSSAGEVKVGDLGLAKCVGEMSTELTTTGMTMGSPHYISPEQVRAVKDIDFRTDIYSLGCTLYHMLTGRPPFDAEDSFTIMAKHVNEPPPAIADEWPDCPLPLAASLDKMLAKDRDARPGSYEKLIAELLAIHQTLKSPSAPETAGPISPVEPAGSYVAKLDSAPRRKPARVIGVVVGAACVAALAGGWLWFKNAGLPEEQAGLQPVAGTFSEERNTLMKRILGWFLISSAASFAGDLTTLDGTTYRNITVNRVEADGLVIKHAEGVGKVEFLNLPEDVRRRYGFDPAKAEAAKKAAATGWQEMDQRLVFLTVQLASVETSLAALNRVLVSLGINQANQQRAATSAQQANEAMDRNAGGPVPWATFYGNTAEKFSTTQ